MSKLGSTKRLCNGLRWVWGYLTRTATATPIANRDLKILDAAAFKNAVTSERAWVVTATFAREIRALRFALCKRSPKHITTKETTNRFSQRITGIAGDFAAMTSFKKTRELLAGSYLADIISDEEFVLLYDCSFSKNLELPYEEYERFDIEEMADSECMAEFRVNKRDLPHLASDAPSPISL